ncbi:hypothetical protein [Bacillus sp. 37MA]
MLFIDNQGITDPYMNLAKVRKDKIESKGIKSIRSRVANISDLL